MNFRAASLCLPSCLALLAGCAGTVPAPVIDRAPPHSLEQPAAVELKPGHYLVKKGDTLYGIALDHGQDYKEVAAWNKLDNPNLIKVGEVLRVIPPESDAPAAGEVVEMRPVAPPVVIEDRAGTAAPAASESIKREPKGGTQPYTDAAWAALQQPGSVPTPAPAAAPTPVPVPPPATPAQPAPKPAVADIDWAWPSANKLVQTFGEGNSKGFDFDGQVGDPVHAAAAGKVTLVTSSLRGYGNLIVVKHNTTYLSVYAHNSKMLVKEGQTVARGQKIAEIGSSDSERPRLHFEIRREGKPVDPAKYLTPR